MPDTEIETPAFAIADLRRQMLAAAIADARARVARGDTQYMLTAIIVAHRAEQPFLRECLLALAVERDVYFRMAIIPIDMVPAHSIRGMKLGVFIDPFLLDTVAPEQQRWIDAVKRCHEPLVKS